MAGWQQRVRCDVAESYSITLDDVQAYLDSKKDSEPVGIPCHNERCLIAEALRYKYPDMRFSVMTDHFYVEPRLPGQREFGHSLEQVVFEFDAARFPLNIFPGSCMTKAEWLSLPHKQTSAPESEGRNG